MHMGFNRDIVECKVDIGSGIRKNRDRRFNRDIVECKVIRCKKMLISLAVLIET